MSAAGIVRTAGLVALATASYWYIGALQRRRDTPRPLPKPLQTWEGEGGNVPDVPTVTPAPAPPATEAGPAASPGGVH